MPVLSFYEGHSELSFCVFNNELDASENVCFSFPYTYSANLFLNSFSKEAFYNDVFNLAAQTLKVSLKECVIYSTGVLTSPDVPFPVKQSASLLTSLGKNTLFISPFMIGAKDKYYSFYTYSQLDKVSTVSLNADLYTNIAYTDTRDIVAKDYLLRSIASVSDIKLSTDSLIVTGDRFRELELNPSLGYLLLLDILKNPGCFYVKLDEKNLYAHTFQQDFTNVSFPSLGTIINAPGNMECLIETEVGSPRMLELKADDVVILPLDSTEQAHIVVKSPELKLDKKVYGGKLGLVFDTRVKSQGIEFKEVYLNNLLQYLTRL